MVSITPCQRIISDRFPVASFVVHAPPNRLFEIACATDPVLFRSDQRHRRTTNNFFATRASGLLRAPAGQATYLLPPDQLRRFAGRQQLFYALGSYAGANGEDAAFSVSPDAAERVPSIRISPDFSGKTLDRSRLLGAGSSNVGARYGAGVDGSGTQLTWGGDLLSRGAADSAEDRKGPRLGGASAANLYDDGYPADLWTKPRPATALDVSSSAPVADPGQGDVSSVLSEPDGYEDAPALALRSPAGLSPAEPLMGGRRGAGAARYGRGESSDNVALANEPSGFEDAPAAAASIGETRYEGGYGGAGGDLPGFEDGVALTAARAARLGGAGADLPGYEDGVAANAACRARYGSGYASAAEAAPPAASAPANATSDSPPTSPSSASAPSLPASASPISGGRDDEYLEDDSAADETELAVDEAGLDLRPTAEAVPLTIPEKFKLVSVVARSESGGGRDGYAAVNADGEFNDPAHPAYHRTHVGLSWGLVQFTQRSGMLGQVLRACQRRDPETFAGTFGPAADELLAVTTARSEEERLGPVGGSLLWQGDWVARFRAAGQVPAFQAAQNEVAIEGFLDPNLPFARWLGWVTDRALAILYDRCVHMGSAAAVRWIMANVGPIRTQRQCNAALRALGMDSLRAFQESVPELEATGRWNALTHDALVGALRLSAPSPLSPPPVAIPPLEQMLDGVVAAARGRRFEGRIRALRTSNDFQDVIYQLGA
jgi:hypothetical protein